MAQPPEPGARIPSPDPRPLRRGYLTDTLLLTAVCLLTYFTGLTNHGLTNWQESQRAQVAREMQQAGEWLVPTINGQPYLAKPPVFYWCQLLLAKVLGHQTSELELRLTVALAGLAGVMATYFLVRRLFVASRTEPGIPAIGREAAIWSALFLATGPLYVRSSRIGELDILLAPFVVTSVLCIIRAWQQWRFEGRVGYGSILLATLAATGAALTKGPPAIAVIAAAGYGPMVLDALFNRIHRSLVPADCRSVQERALDRREFEPTFAHPSVASLLARIMAGLAAVAAAILTIPKVENFTDILGSLIIVLTSGVLGAIFGAALAPANFTAIFRVFARTHPVAVLGLPLLALWGWGRLVSQRIGPDKAAFWANKETEDNLNTFVPESPIKNLEAMSFGVGLGSIIAIIAIVWLITRRPKLLMHWLVPIAWVGFGFAVFSLLGKGIGRYLTPLWPGIAILAGVWLATMLHKDRGAPRVRTALGTTVLLMAALMGWSYGYARELYSHSRSPRALIRETIAANAAPPDRFAAFEYWSAALDFYAGHRVQPVGDIQIRDVTCGGKPWTIQELRDDIVTHGPRVVFMRDRQLGNDGRDPRPVAERLRAIGLTVEPLSLPPAARFDIDSGKRQYIAAKVSVRTAPLPAASLSSPPQ